MTQRGDQIRVRAASGRLLRVVARGHGPVYDTANATVLFIDRSGALVRTDSLHVWRLARGFRPDSWVQLLDGRVIDVTTGRRSVFLRANGAPLHIRAPLDKPAAEMGGVVALPDADGVVYVLNRGRTDHSGGVNSVYVARPGTRPKLLYVRRVVRRSCGDWAGLSFSHGRALYVDNQGPLVILDPSGRTRPRDLTPALRALEPRRASRAQLYADWLARWR
jgi:hypothetical protein